jgi:putative nucleotidyltransferase with HDIG domain
MAPSKRQPLSSVAKLYVTSIVAFGGAVVFLSVLELSRSGVPRELWFLAVLTLLSGFLPVKLPKVAANISVSETFVFCGTMLYGPSAGALLVFLDVALIWARLARQEVYWHRMLFSLMANPLAIWLSSTVLFSATDSPPGTSLVDTGPSYWLVLALLVFSILYFLLNSVLVAVAIALEQHLNPVEIWFRHLSRLWSLLFIAPLMLVLFFTYKWSMERVEKAEGHLGEMKRTFLQTIEALALAIDAKDQVTHGHIRRVQRYTMELAEAMGIKDENQLDAIRAAALLHDTGKLAVPEYILNKPGPLTASEFERMKVHAAVGADILKNIEFPYPVEPIVRHHHEAWDGSGYPDGIKGSDIPLGARILSVVDCYDAITSDRPYRPRMTRQQAEQILRERRGKTYDPWVVDQFIKILDQLEKREEAERLKAGTGAVETPTAASNQFEAISATQAEDREFNELRRELPRATSIAEAADILFRHLRRMLPAAGLALYRPRTDATEIELVASAGVGSAALTDVRIPIGERISGWVFAHAQPVLNSEATLEIGPVARTFSVPLRFASAVPVLDGGPVAVLMVFSSQPLEKDHRRVLENAATLFVGAVSQPIPPESRPPKGAEEPGVPSSRSRVH